MVEDISFDVAWRGYDPDQVNELVALLSRAIDSEESSTRDDALAALRDASFDLRMRGYNRRQVESYLDETRAQLSR